MERNLIHCSYHKCLTVYFKKVMNRLYEMIFKYSKGYKHFNSEIDEFYRIFDDYKVASVNNHALNFDKLGSDFRISRFIRDPRDLVVSGYLYHKKGTEVWANIENPTEEDFKIVNGVVPERMSSGQTFTTYLSDLSKEEGLKAEIDFRYNHFHSMIQWPAADDRIKLFRYEDILGNEQDVFEEILSHYGVSWVERKVGRFFADRHSAEKRSGRTGHIRNPSSGQWQKHFTAEVEDYFMKKHGKLLERYGYE